MATNCNKLGEISKNAEIKKQKIEFEFKVSVAKGISIRDACGEPAHYDNITLLCKNYLVFMEKPYDLMYAYDSLTCGDGPARGCLYVGYWNDGIV